MSMVAVVAASVGATACYALSTALKHRSTATVPETAGLAPHKLVRFATATARHPLYLAAILAGTVGLALQVLALHIGALSVVQPLLTTALLFSLIAAHRIAGTRISARELRWGAMLVVALVGFMLAAGTVHAHISPHAQHADRVPAVLAGVLALTLATSCVLTSRRLPRGGAAALMGIAVGTIHACGAALIKSCTNVATSGLVALLTSWQLYLFLLAGGAGLLLTQLGVPGRAPVREPAGDHHRRPAAQRGHRCLGVRRAAEGGPRVGGHRGALPGPAVGLGRPAQPGAGRRGAALACVRAVRADGPGGDPFAQRRPVPRRRPVAQVRRRSAVCTRSTSTAMALTTSWSMSLACSGSSAAPLVRSRTEAR